MKITIHMKVPNTPILKRKMRLELEDGMTVKDALEAYSKAGGGLGAKGSLRSLYFLVNGARAGASQTLSDRDRLEVLRPMIRG